MTQKSRNLVNRDFYHSPYTLKESFPLYPPLENDLSAIYQTDTFDYIAGAKIIAFHNFTNMIGISGYCHFVHGKRNTEENDYTIHAAAQLRYNILSRLYFTTSVHTFSTQSKKFHFSTAIDFGYVIF